MGRLIALAARLPRPRNIVLSSGGEKSSEETSWGPAICSLACSATAASLGPSTRPSGFLRTVPSLDEPETSLMSESWWSRWREKALRGRWKSFTLATVKGDFRGLMFSGKRCFELRCRLSGFGKTSDQIFSAASPIYSPSDVILSSRRCR